MQGQSVVPEQGQGSGFVAGVGGEDAAVAAAAADAAAAAANKSFASEEQGLAGGLPGEWMGRDPVVDHTVRLHLMHMAAVALQARPWVASLDVIHRSRVPLIKLLARCRLPCR